MSDCFIAMISYSSRKIIVLKLMGCNRIKKKKYDAEETKLENSDPRWERFQANYFLFPDAAQNHADLLRQLREEDNSM